MKKNYLFTALALLVMVFLWNTCKLDPDENIIDPDEPVEVGVVLNGIPPDNWLYKFNETGTRDAAFFGKPYYYIQNGYARFHIGTNVFNRSGEGSMKGGSLAQGMLMDAVDRSMNEEILDYAVIHLLKNSEADYRNWNYPAWRLRLPDITFNSSAGTITCNGGWKEAGWIINDATDPSDKNTYSDYSIDASLTYSMPYSGPILKFSLTLTSKMTARFTGRLGYFYNMCAFNPYAYAYIPGTVPGGELVNATVDSNLERLPWVTVSAAGGTPVVTRDALPEGSPARYIVKPWSLPFVFCGKWEDNPNPAQGNSQPERNEVVGYNGWPTHTVTWLNNQQPSMVVPCAFGTGAWWDVDLTAGASQTIVWYHVVRSPKETGDGGYEIGRVLAEEYARFINSQEGIDIE